MKRLLLLACLLILAGCGKEDTVTPPVPGVPVLATASVDSVTSVSARCGGLIASDGGAAITARGVCWSTGELPTISDSKTIDSSGAGRYSSRLTRLAAKTTYRVRAYASNSAGTGYGSEVVFRTPSHAGAMVFIPAGAFIMGDITGRAGQAIERPVHEVTISHGFFMGRTEVTQAQWKAVTGSKPRRDLGDNMPITLVDWNEAFAFCNQLSIQDGYDTCYRGSGAAVACDFASNGYRLPTEAEWEYACRAGTQSDYYTGIWSLDGFGCTPSLDPAGWYSCNANIQLHDIGMKKDNAFGLYDMHGNVYEMCWDWFSDAYYTSTAVTDPRGPAAGSERICRGGSYLDNPTRCRSAYRGTSSPDARTVNKGFRVVRVDR